MICIIPTLPFPAPSLVLRYYSSGVIPAGSSFTAMNLNEWEGMKSKGRVSFYAVVVVFQEFLSTFLFFHSPQEKAASPLTIR